MGVRTWTYFLGGGVGQGETLLSPIQGEKARAKLSDQGVD